MFFHKVALVHNLGEVDIFSHVSTNLFLLTMVQNLSKSIEVFQSSDHKGTATSFSNHSVVVDLLLMSEIIASFCLTCCFQ